MCEMSNTTTADISVQKNREKIATASWRNFRDETPSTGPIYVGRPRRLGRVEVFDLRWEGGSVRNLHGQIVVVAFEGYEIHGPADGMTSGGGYTVSGSLV